MANRFVSGLVRAFNILPRGVQLLGFVLASWALLLVLMWGVSALWQAFAGCMAEPPPARYDHPPAHSYRVVEMAPKFLAAIGNPRGLRGGEYLCGLTIPETHTILIREGLSARERASVMRHEIGHLNGWRHKPRQQ